MMREISDLFALVMNNNGQIKNNGSSDQDALKLINDLENEMALKENKVDS